MTEKKTTPSIEVPCSSKVGSTRVDSYKKEKKPSQLQNHGKQSIADKAMTHRSKI